jgi:hypothetical protein
MFQGLAVKQAPNTGSPDRTGAGSRPLPVLPPQGGLRRATLPIFFENGEGEHAAGRLLLKHPLTTSYILLIHTFELGRRKNYD